MPPRDTSAADFLPERRTMRSLPEAARSCHVLRQRGTGAREAAMRALVADLRNVAKVLNGV